MTSSHCDQWPRAILTSESIRPTLLRGIYAALWVLFCGNAICKEPSSNKLKATITSGQHNSVLNEHRNVGSGATDFAERYQAAAIDGKQQAVKVVDRFCIKGKPMLWFNEAKTAVVADKAVFPLGLEVINVTKSKGGESRSPGVIDPSAFKEIGILRLAEFLVCSGTILTWMHIESTISPIGHTEESASFSGSHRYFTNRENIDPIAFTIRVDQGGKITVTDDRK